MDRQNLSAQLKDIKLLPGIPDNSFCIYWGLIMLGELLIYNAGGK